MILLLNVTAFVLLCFAAFGAPSGRVSLGWLGLALLVLGTFIGALT